MSQPGRGRSGSSSSRGTKPKQGSASRGRGGTSSSSSRAVVPRGTRAAVPAHGPQDMQAVPMRKIQGPDGQVMLAPEGYTMRKVEPAKNYDVISFGRAMNDDFGGRVKKLFDPEREAALAALDSGVYIGWRCPEFTWDCQRVSSMSKCFCGHLLGEHAPYNSRSTLVPCRQCKCKAYAWIPSRPEEIGEFWHQRRRDFDPEAWRAKCRCKHTHEEHDPNSFRSCKRCGCSRFDSPFVCAACDRHWEDHETFFEDGDERRKKGMPVGEEYLPFSEIPSLRNMVLTGEDDGDMSYMKVMQAPECRALPPNQPADNNTVVPYGTRRGGARGGGGGAKGSFRPVYD